MLEDFQVLDLGEVSYEAGVKFQRDLVAATLEARKLQRVRHTLIFCTHPPTFTYGKSVGLDEVFLQSGIGDSLKYEIHPTDRGGKGTYLGPEQIIMYPILDLTAFRRDVAWYLRKLEEVVIGMLSQFEIAGKTLNDKTGVWIDEGELGYSKIASIGVRLSRWISMHGVAINVSDCKASFSLIRGCGLDDLRVTCMSNLLQLKVSREEIKVALKEAFLTAFAR